MSREEHGVIHRNNGDRLTQARPSQNEGKLGNAPKAGVSHPEGILFGTLNKAAVLSDQSSLVQGPDCSILFLATKTESAFSMRAFLPAR